MKFANLVKTMWEFLRTEQIRLFSIFISRKVSNNSDFNVFLKETKEVFATMTPKKRCTYIPWKWYAFTWKCFIGLKRREQYERRLLAQISKKRKTISHVTPERKDRIRCGRKEECVHLEAIRNGVRKDAC